jgi:predicted nuclease of predicted toxin-antitoxin system
MTKSELFKLLDKLKREKGLRFDYGDSFEGAQYIRFEVDDDGDKLLSEATDEEIIAFADDEGYTLTVKDCQAIREGKKDGETIREAVNAFLIEEEDEDE